MPASASAAMTIDNDAISTFATDNTKEVCVTLNPNRAYRLKHRGKDNTGTADVNDILMGSGGAQASVADGNGIGIIENGDIIEVSGVSNLSFKAKAGNPCLTITVLANQVKMSGRS